jgi:hypothetical protein
MKTQNESKHTPAPWEVKDGSYNINGDHMKWIAGPDHIVIAMVTDKNLKDTTRRDADAAFIVRAVNSHEALLAIAKAAERMMYGHLDTARDEGEKTLGQLLTRHAPAIQQAEGK